MTHVLKALVGEVSTSTGTGAFALSAALAAPITHRRFNAVCAVGDTVEYLIRHATDNTWEAGIGTYSAANTLTRTLVIESSNSNAAVAFAAGDKTVLMTPLASRWNHWELVSVASPSAASSVVFTDLSAHFEYRVTFDLLNSVGNENLRMHISNDNGATWITDSFFSYSDISTNTQSTSTTLRIIGLETSYYGYEPIVELLRPYGIGGLQYFRVSVYDGMSVGHQTVVADCYIDSVNAIKLQPSAGNISGTVSLFRKAR